MKNKIITAILTLLCVSLTQCSNRRFVENLLNNSFNDNTDTCLVDFSQLPFAWDSVFFISGRIDSPMEISRILGGCKYSKINDPGSRIIFMHKGEVIYEEAWLTTERYANYVYYYGNNSYIVRKRQFPLFIAWKSGNRNNEIYYIEEYYQP